MDSAIQTRRGGDLAGLAKLALGAAALGLLFWQLSEVVLLIFFAVLFAVALRGAAVALCRWVRLPPSVALAGLVVILTLLAIGTVWWVAPRVAAQLQDLVARMSADFHLLKQRFGDTPWAGAVFDRLDHLNMSNLPVANSAETVADVSLETISGIVVVAVTALYLAISPDLYVSGTVKLAPMRWRPHARAVMGDVARTLRWWMVGQLVDMLAVGTLAAVGLSMAGVPAPLALGLIAGVATFVPYFGSVLSAIPAILVGLSVDWRLGIWVIVIFLICHIVEGYVVAPLVQRRMVNLPPALSIVGMTVMGTLFGALGIILATPLVATGLVLVRRLYVEDVLGDPAE